MMEVTKAGLKRVVAKATILSICHYQIDTSAICRFKASWTMDEVSHPVVFHHGKYISLIFIHVKIGDR